ncbi:hypothetical protein [Spirosoma flavum]|uniref:YD repeat-containing protein n=1 Tax=Spirosoma flavum TaxID=2048557 RepID=A0ABW6AMK0_9BACT
MNTTHLRKWLICLLLLVGFLGCTDHRIPAVTPGSGSNRLRVKTITQDQPGNTAKVSAFKYDSQGRLSLIVGFQTPDSTMGPVENSVYTYDAQNRLTQLRREVVRRSGSSPNPVEVYTFSYNMASQVAQLLHSPSTFGVGLQYASDNRLSGYAKGINVAGLQSSGGGTFTFTGNNLTFATETLSVIRSGGPSIPVYSRSTNTTYTFDDKTNPFYGPFIIPTPGVFGPMPVSGSFGPYYSYYGGIDNLLNLSQNNVLSAGNSTYAYTYNGASLPTSRITTTSGTVTETLHYDYETY